ncbi:anti-sigma-K factor RskA [Rhodococcus sp. PvR044]|jgi:anti-sigma-K factor RskA|uniref:anti-sigma factor n=1 Tax=unclassified Rhodococcus (in: high G+C Gram-positive bacteria) TaxID=192944 RepID=UPI000BD733B5|nr:MULTISPECIES: anti-sigma factor [unclassified Rhodococcus (in: high G+C Gram-positive bacteria)]MBP1162843.1 anti-sigma-K factor RskA [Rhodococcus sp. PvR099]PTR44210.1 anti-sigma-K factor RskA [Rhodococcus sp. OK611]SNX89651.1 Anti-sigma-K factor RskA [Rhodococcus sp. OK270]
MDDDQIDLAHAYALDALDADQRRAVEQLLATSDDNLRVEFEAVVRQGRETMAATAAAYATPPPAHIRERLLTQIAREPRLGPGRAAAPVSLTDRRRATPRWRLVGAAAAAVALLAGGVFIGQQLRETTPPQPVAAQVMSAPDVRTSSTEVPGGGSATAVYSRSTDAAVLMMNDVTPPASDSVYQMWLFAGTGAPVSAGMMAPDQVSPSTVAVLDDLDGASLLAFTVEPAGGSEQPTTDVFASLPLG